MGFQKIDKKQLPQVIGLGVASCGMFGYFAFKMIAPTASAAPPPPPAKNAKFAAAAAAASAAPTSGGAAAAAVVTDALPPTPGMRDPFVPTISDKVAPAAPAPAAPAPAAKTQVASLEGVGSRSPRVPVVPPLPSPEGGDRPAPFAAEAPAPDAPASADRTAGGLPPMPVAPPPAAPPSWTVTGVLQDGAENLAILRSGEERRIVRTGDMVDGEFRIVDVTRASVVLRHGSARYVLPLGGAPAPTAKRRTPAQAGSEFHGDSAPAATAAAVSPDAPAAGLAAALQEHQGFQDVVNKLGAAPQGVVDSALSQAQDLLGKH